MPFPTRALALACAAAMMGCTLNAPSAPIDAPRASASSQLTRGLGALAGRVFGDGGGTQAIGLALVTAGGVSGFSANPKDDEVVAEDDMVKDKEVISVMHAFAPGAEPELALRVRRKTQPTPDNADRYVYLRLGEFFLEGVPMGNMTLSASFGNVTSSPNPVTVFENKTVEDLTLQLFIPEPMIGPPNGNVPRIVDWAKLEPAEGIAVSTSSRGIRYQPDPPDVSVTLKAPPGSPGTDISAYEVTYAYTTPNRQREGKPPNVVGPIVVPIPPLTVPAAQEIAFGPPITIKVSIGSRTLNDIFKGGQDDRPGQLFANIEFMDDKGVPVPNRDLNTLKVQVPIRVL